MGDFVEFWSTGCSFLVILGALDFVAKEAGLIY